MEIPNNETPSPGSCSRVKLWWIVPALAGLAVTANLATLAVNWMTANKAVQGQLAPNALNQANTAEQLLIRLATAINASRDEQMRQLLNKHGVNYNESTLPPNTGKTE